MHQVLVNQLKTDAQALVMKHDVVNKDLAGELKELPSEIDKHNSSITDFVKQIDARLALIDQTKKDNAKKQQ